MASSAPVSDVRSFFTDTRGRRWRWVVDDRMRDYGDIDYNRRVIRINRQEKLLDVMEGEKLLATVPITPGVTGGGAKETPAGAWKIVGID